VISSRTFWPKIERAPSRWPRRRERFRRLVVSLVFWTPALAAYSALGVLWIMVAP
jgi:hypothetical protein